jgi:transcriptional regulator with XRE-family HTH domain
MNREPVYALIGATIRSKRRERDWSQELLAKQLGISRAALANIEAGRQRILVHQLYAFAEALGLRADQLLPVARELAPVEDAIRMQMPDNLSAEQVKQIAALIGTIQTSTSNPLDKTNAKRRTPVSRRAR